MEALEFRIDPSEEIVDITNFRCANSVFLEKDIKEVRVLIKDHLHWYTHTKPNGTVVRGTRSNLQSAAPAASTTTEDVREKDTAVAKKRVVTVAQEEGFQVVLSPVAQEIDKRYQELLAKGKTPAEATQFMMNQVAAPEMAAFMEWLRYKEK